MKTSKKRKKSKKEIGKFSLVLLSFLLIGIAAFPQSKTITGKIVDNMNEPLIGATITVKNTTLGAITDIDGNYNITVPESSSVLVFGYLGFEHQEITVGTRSVINVTMQSDLHVLEEIVVVGYTTIRRQSLTGSLQTVDNKKLLDMTTPSAENLLTGKAPGVFVVSPSGRPGDKASIIIRGRSTINGSTDPLWVIDGVIVGNSPYDLSPNDIESMTVLKDAASTAVYGSQGANGVIVVTTKKARSGKAVVNASVKFVATKLNNGNMKMMNGSQLYDYFDSFPNKSVFDTKWWWNPELRNKNYDWWDGATQTGHAQDYNVTISGGNEKLRTYVSLGYYDEKGAIKGYDFTRYNTILKVEYEVAKWLTIKPQIIGSMRNVNDKEHDVNSMYSNLPWDYPIDDNGNLVSFNPISTWVNTTGSNYLWDLQWNFSKSKTYDVSGNFDFDIRITDWLRFASVNNYKFNDFTYTSYQDSRSSGGEASNGQIEEQTRTYNRRYTGQLLRINKSFDRHSVNAVLGYEWNEYNAKTTQSRTIGIPPGFIVGSTGMKPAQAISDRSDWAMQSYLSNINYSFDNKYLAQTSLRRDGSSRISNGERWGTFFSLSGGWNIHNEKFFKFKDINQLKLRASYGSVGNLPQDLYPYQGLFSVKSSYGYNEIPGAVVTQFPNNKLKWEKSMAFGVGLDISYLDRFNFTFDYYKKNTTDLLFRVPLPAVVGVNGIWRNVGEVENHGFEFSASADIIKNKDWLWNVSGNIALNRNKMKKLYGGMTQIIADDGSYIAGSANKLYKPGKDVDTWYLKEWAGVDPETGKAQYYMTDNDGNRIITNNYTNADYVEKGSYSPDFYGGFSTNIIYKDFDLEATFGYSVGGKIYNYARTEFDSDGAYTDRNQMKLHSGWKRWEKPGDMATHPQASYNNTMNNNSNSVSSRFLETGTYLKMRNLTLGYTIPKSLLNISNLRIYISGENLFTITHFSGVDPEMPPSVRNAGTINQSQTLSGTAIFNYPQTRKFVFGMNITL